MHIIVLISIDVVSPHFHLVAITYPPSTIVITTDAHVTPHHGGY